MGATILICQHVSLANRTWTHAAQWNMQPGSRSIRHHHLPTLQHKSTSEHNAAALQGTRHNLMPPGTIHIRLLTYLLPLKPRLACMYTVGFAQLLLQSLRAAHLSLRHATVIPSTGCNIACTRQILLRDCLAGVDMLLQSLCANSRPSAAWTCGSVCKDRYCSFYNHPGCGCTGACCHWYHSVQAEERGQDVASEC